MPSFRLWLRLGTREKISSIGGTLRRIKVRRLREPEPASRAEVRS
jgi:coenzyme F420 hydrogenase subunit beta